MRQSSMIKLAIAVASVIVASGCHTCSGAINKADAGQQPKYASNKKLLKQRTFYFPTNVAKIADSDKASLLEHAKKIKESPNRKLVINGYADERGKSGYNKKLSARRARAAEKLLVDAGVPQHQVTIMPYGSGSPVALGNDEASWKLNRRIELKYERA